MSIATPRLLLYLALHQKQKMPLSDKRNVWLNNLGFVIREFVAEEVSQLTEFNASYEQKTGDKLALTIKKFKSINPLESKIFYEDGISPHIISWFLLENINRSSSRVKDAFSRALVNSSRGFSSDYGHYQENETKKAFMKGMAFLKTKYSESKEQLKGVVEQLAHKAQEKTAYQAILKKDDLQTVNLTSLCEELQKVADELDCYTKKLNSVLSLHEPSCAFKGNNLEGVIFNDSVTSEENYLRLKKEIETLEKIVRDFVCENRPIVLVKSLLNMILAIKRERAWFQAGGFSLLALIEQGFKRGYFFNKQLKLHKLKARLAKKVSFVAEKQFFYSESFFTLLSFGIIRWFWLDKEVFAKHWAEQLILLKVVDIINERNYEQLLTTNVINEVERNGELGELYQQIMSAREEKASIKTAFPKLSQDIASLHAKIASLSSEITSCIWQEAEACSSLKVKSVSANSRNFFNSDRNQIGKAGILSVCTVVKP